MTIYPALLKAYKFCLENDIDISDDVLEGLRSIGIKTEAYYLRTLSRAVRKLYAGDITRDEFLTTQLRLLDEQIRRAWNAGMRLNGLDPATDMTAGYLQIIDEIQNNELNYVERFAQDIINAKLNGESIDPLIQRAELWAHRYQDVVNRAKLETADANQNFKWVLGPTEQHCPQCSALDGIVASASEWRQSNIRPQNPPNTLLDCGGWRCQCELQPTDQRRSPRALESIMNVVVAQNV